MFGLPCTVAQQIKDYLANCYPNEGCGIVLKDFTFVPCENVSPEPQKTFEIADKVYLKHIQNALAIVHSHPDSSSEPTADDMRAQLNSNILWGLCSTSEIGEATDLWFWGTDECVPPLIGRPFRHGPSGTDGRGDCYALIKDYFLLEQGVRLPEYPRDNNWWAPGNIRKENTPPLTLYDDYFQDAGFKEISAAEARVGDVCFMRLGPNVTVNNHACIIAGHNLFLHHLTDRPSRQEPINRWDKFITKWVRYCV